MSQLQPTIIAIEGKTYTIRMLTPMRSHDLLMDVAKMVGPALGPVLDALFGGARGNLDAQVGVDFFSKAAAALFSGIDKPLLREVIKALAEVTEVDNKPLAAIFEIHFAGALDEMYKWLAAAMKVQWGKSLSALVAVVNAKGATILGTTS